MVDNSIIQTLGAGSGIDTKGLVKQLVEIEGAATQQRIDTKRETAETQISDFGLLSNAMATLQDAAEALAKPEALKSKSASYTDSNALVPVELGTEVAAGSYTFTAEAVASSQSLKSTVFSDPTDAVGEGTLTFKFGTVSVDGAGAMLTTNGFDQDVDTDAVVITIDDTNNTLEGLRDAINDADFGVQASIVNDGLNGYVLQISAESGLTNQLEITASESGGTPTNNDGSGLSRFTFNETASQMEQTQAGADAELTFNGLTVYRESNTIDDIVDGLKISLLGADPGTPVTVTVTDDSAYAEESIRTFVDAYNAFFEALEPITGMKEQENEDGDIERVPGSLANDALASSMISKIRAVMSDSVPGLINSDITILGALGIETERDGTLSIDEDKFAEVMDERLDDIQSLFTETTSTTDNGIYVNSYNDYTDSGEYDVVITTQPAKGIYNGSAITDINGTGTYDFTLEVNGTTSGTVSIASGGYASEDDVAEALQAAINADSNLSDAGDKVVVTYDSGNNRFDITSTEYGTSSQVSILTASADITTDLGISVATGTAGATVAGTINGVTAFGSGNVLLPAIGEPGEGMALVVDENTTSATVTVSRGIAGELAALIEEFVGSKGLIATREGNLEESLDGLDDDQKNLDRRLSIFEERLINQYIQMESIISSLNSSGTYLDNLINALNASDD